MVQLIKMCSSVYWSIVCIKLPFKSYAFLSGTKYGTSSLQYEMSHNIAILLPAQLEHTYGMKWEKYLARRMLQKFFMDCQGMLNKRRVLFSHCVIQTFFILGLFQQNTQVCAYL